MNIQKTLEWLQLYESNKIKAKDLARELKISKESISAKEKTYQILRKNYCLTKSPFYI